MQVLDIKFEQWKKRLLDLGKRNRLINFRETKRSNILITSPNCEELYKKLVTNEEKLSFPFPIKVTFDENGEEQVISIKNGDFSTNKSINEQQKTLKALRSRAKTGIEEQGINTLFLTFGMVRWKESDISDLTISSPLILVPVSLTIESIMDPYILQLHEDEIVVNPSLTFKFENDFGIVLPEFDGHEDDLSDYLSKIGKIAKKNGWEVINDVHLTLLSFLKINMYSDLNQNKDKVVSNPIIKAICGDKSEISTIPEELNNYYHDKNIRPIDTYQVVDADSSQQDAILLSKKGVSFVLQGPPGTGKSQTITNIIAETIADGKKILFVSEKMAALEVVKKRLTESGLDDFCLTLHSYKANKKEVLNQLSKTLNLQRISLRDNALYQLSVLEEKRNKLNEYNDQVHSKCMPLNISIYEANGRLAKLASTQDVIFDIKDIEKTDVQLLNRYTYLLNEFSNTAGKLTEDYLGNPWYDCHVHTVTHELRHDIEVNLNNLSNEINQLIHHYEDIIKNTGADILLSINNISILIELLEFSSKSPSIPIKWLSQDIVDLIAYAEDYFNLFSEYKEKKGYLIERYTLDVFNLNVKNIISTIESNMDSVNIYLNKDKFPTNKDIVLKAESIISESKKLQEFIQVLNETRNEIALKLGIEVKNTSNSLLELNELLELVSQNPQPKANWFHYSEIQNIKKTLDETEKHLIKLKDSSQNVRSNFIEKVIEIDYETLLSRFERDYKDVLSTIEKYNTISNNLEINVDSLISFSDNESEQLKKNSILIRNMVDNLYKLQESIGVTEINSFKEIIPLKELLFAIIQNPKPTLAWFDESKELAIDKVIDEIKTTLKDVKIETDELISSYNKDILNIDYKNMLIRFNTEYRNMFKFFKSNYNADKKIIKGYCKDLNRKLTDDDIILILQKISSINEKEQWIINIKPIAIEMLGSLYIDNYTNWEAIDKSRNNFKIIKNYFKGNKIPNNLKQELIDENIYFLTAPYSAIAEIIENDVINYIQSTLGFDVEAVCFDDLQNRMQKVIELTSMIKKDCLEMAKYSTDKSTFNKCTVDDIVATLKSIKNIQNNRSWIYENDALLKDCFGNYYLVEDTDCNNIRKRIELTEQIIDYFGNKQIPNKLISYLVSSHEIEDNLYNFINNINDINSCNIINRLYELLNIADNQSCEFDKLLKLLKTIENNINVTYYNYKDFFNCATIEMEFEAVMQDLIIVNRIQEIENKVDLNYNELLEKFDYKFNGINTDWNEIISSLKYTSKIIDYYNKYSLSHEFIAKICEDKSLSQWLIKYRDILNLKEINIITDFEWYAGLFENSEVFYNTSLYTILDKIKKSINNLFLLEEWIDFRSVRQQCNDVGLSEFVEKVEQVCMNSNVIVNTFFKRFYRLWLDVMIPRYPAVYNFRSRSHYSLIREFNDLDKLQLKIAKLRIKERLISHLPDSNFATSSVDEVGILKRELMKQKKIKPLRRLFKEIPNLLTSLKPCLMMSPLSVSLYLQADGYYFDTVIFDEASQVLTEDAIGAIMRGKQVIIAGDSKQLPPTNFFATSLSGEDFDADNDEEYDDAGAYESVLEEAINAIPERTLKWHYRSRHEHLIAFSNAKIYNNELITFPSNVDQMANNGVEYVYVENGIYDRGGKKHNLNEAKRVAELVFEHFRRYPNRSLGVVTFSGSQQNAVDAAISQLRRQNSQYEKYFDEEKEQSFFIKNLENVQGDERDTIILSIGYAKDQNGVMYMNFGPLSRNGGYRRLNVAITRAKYNIKLVGSIHPTDIRIENTNSEGLKMLRQYIEFAINGATVLQNELKFTNNVDVESPFEEAVYDFLIKNGYEVTTQVGCSGYRIDMAVKHPNLSGIFILGIECDGASYHSARTARERDRIRQTVLEDIGWTIYRIWSTDWIKDTKTEGEKLIDAVKMAISNYKVANLDRGSVKQSEVDKNESNFTENSFVMVENRELENEFTEENPCNFDYYEETDLNEVERVTDHTQFIANAIKFVVEREYPIHYELLCKRVAPLFGNQKATVKVRNSVDAVWKKRLKDSLIKKEDFCWIKDLKDVKVKIPIPNGEGRPINYISTEELAEAMYAIAIKSFGVAKKDLYVVTARAFGFNRTGGNIIVAMENACMYLIKGGKVKEVDEKIIVCN